MSSPSLYGGPTQTTPPGPPVVPPEPEVKQGSDWKRGAIEWLLVLLGAVGVALLIITTSIQAFFIPSGSMKNTLGIGDRVLVNKWSYRLHPIHRGDIVVFSRPDGETATNVNDLIKRVIGLPGESITIHDNHVFIDGRQLDEPYLPPGVTTQNAGTHQCPVTKPCVVPAKQIWVMGDNRNDSADSRFFGPIPESKVVGRAFFRIWPLNRLGGL
jgi:signal peptidase I